MRKTKSCLPEKMRTSTARRWPATEADRNGANATNPVARARIERAKRLLLKPIIGSARLPWRWVSSRCPISTRFSEQSAANRRWNTGSISSK